MTATMPITSYQNFREYDMGQKSKHTEQIDPIFVEVSVLDLQKVIHSSSDIITVKRRILISPILEKR